MGMIDGKLANSYEASLTLEKTSLKGKYSAYTPLEDSKTCSTAETTLSRSSCELSMPMWQVYSCITQ